MPGSSDHDKYAAGYAAIAVASAGTYRLPLRLWRALLWDAACQWVLRGPWVLATIT